MARGAALYRTSPVTNAGEEKTQLTTHSMDAKEAARKPTAIQKADIWDQRYVCTLQALYTLYTEVWVLSEHTGAPSSPVPPQLLPGVWSSGGPLRAWPPTATQALLPQEVGLQKKPTLTALRLAACLPLQCHSVVFCK